MTQLLSHLSDIGKFQFLEPGPVWLQALPLGTYEHPVHGTINVTQERVQHFVDNFKNKVREQDLDVDYDHKILDTKAAGWISAAENRGEAGLWIAVDFTPPALEKLKNKEFKYFSSEFQDEWTHPKTQTKYQDVLFGGALTNRPFIKDILPINLSEIVDGLVQSQKPTIGDDMALDPKLKANLIGLYQLSETASDEEVQQAVQDQVDEPEETEAEKVAREAAEEVERQRLASETDEDKQLSELFAAYPVLKKLAEPNKQMTDRLAELELANRLSETTIRLNTLSEKGKFAIPPAMLTEARALSVQLNEAQNAKLMSLLENLTKTGVIDLTERGGTRTLNDNKTGIENYTEAVTKLSEEQKIPFSEAAAIVSAADPDLFAAYREESTNRN